MFDISFGELMLIGVIALVVIGPQRLPTVARTLGHLIGRAQRYVNDVKHDIQKEMDLEELSKVKNQMESAARSVQASVQDISSSLSKPIEDAQQTLSQAASSLHDSVTTDSPIDAAAHAEPDASVSPATDSADPAPPARADATT